MTLNLNSDSSSNIIVGESQATTVKINGVQYTFGKSGDLLAIYPFDNSLYQNNPTQYYRNAIINPQQGQTYQWLGINIKIDGIYPDRYIISISSTDSNPSPTISSTPTAIPSTSPTPNNLGSTGNGEQIAITNVQCVNDVVVYVTVENTGSSTVTITNAYINGNEVELSGPYLTFTGTVDVGISMTFTLTLPSGSPPFTNSAQYTVKLYTSNDNSITSTFTYMGQ